MKKRVLLCFVLGLSLLTTGCSDMMIYETQTIETIELPETVEENVSAPWGDSQSNFLDQAELYYINEDAQMLAQSTATFMLTPEEDKIETVLLKLLNETPDEASPMAPEGTKLLGFEVTRDVVTVNFSLEARNVSDDKRLLWMYNAVAATLLSMENINSVNILINGRQEAVEGIPVGVITQTDRDLATLWAQHQADADRIERLSTTSSFTRTAILYFPFGEGDWYIAEPQELTFVGENYATALLAALSQKPKESNGRAPINAVNALMTSPYITLTDTGFRCLALEFTSEIIEILQKSAITRDEFAGMLALTMTSFIPELDGIMLFIDGELVVEVSGDEEYREFVDGVILRNNYRDQIGDVVTLYFASENGKLVAEKSVVSPLISRSPRTLLVQLMQGSSANNSVMPAGVSGDDILGVRIDNGIAYINLSANFYRLCQNMDYVAERNLVYSIVNTLTELSNVNRVRFFFEGRSAGELANSIYLNTMLLPNPGLIENAD